MNGRGLFFKPIPFGNQLPDLAVQLIDLPLLGLLRPLPFAGERFWNRRKRLFLPSVDLGGVNTILRRQLIAGFLLTDRLQGHFGLELDRMPFTYSCHVSPGLSLLPSILKAGLEYGEYHTLGENLPWGGRQLIVGTGMYGRLPVMPEVVQEATRRKIELVVVPTEEACRLLADRKDKNIHAVLHVTC